MATTSRLPKWIKPQLAHLAGEAPAGDQPREQMLPVCLPRKRRRTAAVRLRNGAPEDLATLVLCQFVSIAALSRSQQELLDCIGNAERRFQRRAVPSKVNASAHNVGPETDLVNQLV